MSDAFPTRTEITSALDQMSDAMKEAQARAAAIIPADLIALQIFGHLAGANLSSYLRPGKVGFFDEHELADFAYRLADAFVAARDRWKEARDVSAGESLAPARDGHDASVPPEEGEEAPPSRSSKERTR